MPRLAEFRGLHPQVELRLLTNNNKVDLAGESLYCAIRFGDGAWRSFHADLPLRAPLSPLCAAADAAKLGRTDDLAKLTLLRSYRPRCAAASCLKRARARWPPCPAANLPTPP